VFACACLYVSSASAMPQVGATSRHVGRREIHATSAGVRVCVYARVHGLVRVCVCVAQLRCQRWERSRDSRHVAGIHTPSCLCENSHPLYLRVGLRRQRATEFKVRLHNGILWCGRKPEAILLCRAAPPPDEANEQAERENVCLAKRHGFCVHYNSVRAQRRVLHFHTTKL